MACKDSNNSIEKYYAPNNRQGLFDKHLYTHMVGTQKNIANEWVISEKERQGWVGNTSQKKWGQKRVLEVGWDLAWQRNHSKQDYMLEMRNMDAKDVGDSRGRTGQSGRANFYPGKGFWWMVSEGGFGEECWHGAILGVNVTVWWEITNQESVVRMLLYCSCPIVKQMPQWILDIEVAWLVHFHLISKSMAYFMPRSQH